MTEARTQTKDPVTRRRFLRWLGIGAAGMGGAVVGGGVTGRILNAWYGNQLAAPDAPREGVAVAPTSVTTEAGMQVHHIQTGYVAVKRVHRSFDGADGQGILAIATARHWTEWLPISVWVIEHPDGVILVDTGETPEVNDPDYFACDSTATFFYGAFLRFSVTPDEAIDAQLRTLGIVPNDVRWIVQTHLHGDHVHGLHHFPNAEVLVSPRDYPTSQGAVPCLYPDNFDPTLVTFSADDTPVFAESYTLTRAGDVAIIPTPGHSYGHQSVLLRDGDLTYFFAGDTSFDEAQMLADGVAGIAIDPAVSRRTTASIRAYAGSNPTVYLPSHDHESSARLRDRQTVAI